MKILKKVSIGLLVLVVPFVILMTSVRIMIQPLYAQIEYRMPGFPDDPFGFSLTDRLRYSKTAINYLLNNADITYLSSQTFPDGSPLYNDRELSHMLDVKKLVQAMITAWVILIAITVLISLLAWQSHWLSDYLSALRKGSYITLGLIGLIVFFVLTSFDGLFTAFHQVFFTGDTWLFYTSDTLIRLFPMRFWQDAFIGTGIFSVLFAILLLLGTRFFNKRIPQN